MNNNPLNINAINVLQENTERETENYDDYILSISSTEDCEEDETPYESYPSINNKSLTSSPVKRASSEVKNEKKIKTNNDVRVDEPYNFRRSIQENVKLMDDFSVYGENVARRIRSANQNGRAISIAKNLIDNILFKLEMGVFLISEEDKFVTTQNLNLYQIPNNINNRYFPEIYTSQATPTHTSDLISVSSSSPYPSPSSVQSQPMHSFHTLQQQNQSTPILYELENQSEENWQPYTFNTPQLQQLQSQITFQQQSSDIAELDEFLVRRANSR